MNYANCALGSVLMIADLAQIPLKRFNIDYCLWVLSYIKTPHKLNCRSTRHTQKIKCSTNQKGYENSEITIGKPSARRILICRVHFFVIIFEFLFFTTGLPIGYKLGPYWDDVISWSNLKARTVF